MKILVFSHELIIGGTQIGAIELSAALREWHGHNVVLFATPGPLISLANQKGLRFVPAPRARMHPSPERIRALNEVIRKERPDVIHVWDWWQYLDSFYVAHLLMRIPMVVTDMMSHGIERVLPIALPITFGVPEIADRARALGRRHAEVLLPPVDVAQNAPDVVSTVPFRERFGIKNGDITLVTVSRLAPWIKGESLLRTVEAVRVLGRHLPLRLLIVGDGPMRSELERLAGIVNAELGRPAVALTGPLVDPRAAYAAADVVIGMGGSALRGMAFAKPVLVVGGQNFSLPFTQQTADSFLYKGMYGIGDGRASNERLVGHIRSLLERPAELGRLGEFSRQFVIRHFSLEAVSAKLSEICCTASARKPQFRLAAFDAIRTAAVYFRERRWSYAD